MFQSSHMLKHSTSSVFTLWTTFSFTSYETGNKKRGKELGLVEEGWPIIQESLGSILDIFLGKGAERWYCTSFNKWQPYSEAYIEAQGIARW